jgi:hypothetical protein
MDKWDGYDKERNALNEALLLKALKEIQKRYKATSKEVLSGLSDLFLRLEKNGKLTYADVKRFRDLDRFKMRILAQTGALGDKNKANIIKTLEETYDLSYSHMSYVVENETDILLKNKTPHLPEILAKVKDNPIKGLKLETAVERDRGLIVKGINQGIERGLINGDTYGGIAREIQTHFDSSFRRAVTIAHTETHRVREQAGHDGSMNAMDQGINMIKIWRNMGDQRVRPGRGIGKKDAGNADHRNMEGQTRKEDEMFDLKPSGQTLMPGDSGIAKQDIRCRCYASRRVDSLSAPNPTKQANKTFEDWQKVNKT